MKPAVWIFVGLLLLLHQDYWQWDSPEIAVQDRAWQTGDVEHRKQLIFGTFPYALIYHMGISMAAALGWLLATRFWWPQNLDHSTGSPSESEKP